MSHLNAFTMTTAALKKHQTYFYDEKGNPVMVQLDLRNKALREAYEDWMDAKEAMARENDSGRPFDEFVKEYSPGFESR